MTDLPAPLLTGLVTGRFIAALIDGADSGAEPDVVPAAGKITLTPDVPYLPLAEAEGGAVTVIGGPVVVVLDAEGYLSTPHPVRGQPPMARGVRVLATDSPGAPVTGFTWKVDYSFAPINGRTPTIPSHAIAVPAGGQVDLTTAVKVPSSPGVGIPQVEDAARRAAESAAVAMGAAQEAATAAEAAVEASAGAVAGVADAAASASSSAAAAAAAAGSASTAASTSTLAKAAADAAKADAASAVGAATTAASAATAAANSAATATAAAADSATKAQAAAQAAAANQGGAYTGPPILVLGPSDPVPANAAVGSIIVRTTAPVNGGGQAQQVLGTPVVTSPAVASAASITPNLPTLTAGQVGTLVVVVGQANGSTAWTAPAGWTKLYDNSMGATFGTRPVGVFYAPAGTAPVAFAAPSGGTMRYAAVAFPVAKTPILTGSGYKDSGASNATVTTAAVTFSSPSVPLTIVTANYTTTTSADPPTVPGAQANAISGPAVASGSGAATTLHAITGTPGGSGGGATLTLSQPMASGSNFPTHVLGIGS